ncbi:cobalt-precorrin-5B (C(1))-methyltransferase [Paenibacillus sp. MMS20-IR301]|uniref:cobalt-precorrin-5B (C(1))-methyltransferase n=1 Tax=Paenibacillus sp. MMS20-IR301 TaxID=2895946 RepID=UPI0028EADCAC|nr:cobalt-precorrin-5B (C(1))-methyltransferase [Paenibacillus sp. MMS20-IR301]WNS46553.1 cobalt-precorrin-5B (C(1))-methyltransferase [Paenibacillus sp. MMS20-IR301]
MSEGRADNRAGRDRRDAGVNDKADPPEKEEIERSCTRRAVEAVARAGAETEANAVKARAVAEAKAEAEAEVKAPLHVPEHSTAPAAALRRGYTTGACAAAAAKGAALLLITGERFAAVEIDLPAGFRHTFELTDWWSEGEDSAACATVKDAGDDPDATHQARIEAAVSWLDHPGVEIDGGRGVGRVTKPGLPVPVGAAAINPVPRRMILEAVSGVLEEHGAARGLRVVISVPEGERIAQRTLNPRLGIIGGISILGTKGVVTPFDTEAYKASVVQAISVAAATGNGQIVLTTGGSSEKYALGMFAELPEEAFIQMGEYVGFSLGHAKAYGIRKVTFVGMAGKFSKVAQGAMLIHSRNAPVDFGFLAAVAADAGADNQQVREIAAANTASQVVDMMTEAGNSVFFEQLCRLACEQSLKAINGGMTVRMVLITMKGRVLGRAEVCG